MKKRHNTHLSSPAALKTARNTLLGLPLLAAMLLACSADLEQPHQAAAKIKTATIKTGSPDVPGAIDSTPIDSSSNESSAIAPLDLNISPAMMQPLLEQDGENLQTEILPAETLVIPARSKDDSRVRLTGELYYDDTAEDSGSGYFDAIDGGRLDIEIRFNG